jgi:hypothetical protein
LPGNIEQTINVAQRALTLFEDAWREAAPSGQGKGEWDMVKDFCARRGVDLFVPQTKELSVLAFDTGASSFDFLRFVTLSGISKGA